MCQCVNIFHVTHSSFTLLPSSGGFSHTQFSFSLNYFGFIKMGARSRDKEANRQARIDKALEEEERKESDNAGMRLPYGR